MTVKEMMLKLLKEENDCVDIDFCDDYDERANVAYCGNHWTPEAEEKYARAFNLPIDEEASDESIVVVHCEKSKDAQALADLLYAMAGYIDAEEYDRLFPDPEPEPVPEQTDYEKKAIIHAEKIGVYEFKVHGNVMEYLSFFSGEGWYYIIYDLDEEKETYRELAFPWNGFTPYWLKTETGADRYNYCVG